MLADSSTKSLLKNCLPAMGFLVFGSLLAFAESANETKNSIPKPQKEKPRKTDSAVSEARILDDLIFLSGDEREGRGPGSQGQKESAKYIQKIFADSGLEIPKGEEDAFLEFSTPNSTSMGKTNSLVVQLEGQQPYALKLNQQFNPCSFGASGKFEASVVFCGYGFQLKDHDYDDYANVDLNGKVAVILRRVPQQSKEKAPPFFTGRGRIHRNASLIRKMEIARAHGGVGVIFLTDPFSVRKTKNRLQKQISEFEKKIKANPSQAERQRRFQKPLQKLLKESQGDRLIPFGYGGSIQNPQIPALHMTNAQFDKILKAASKSSLEELEKQIDSDRKPRSFDFPELKFKAEVSINRNEAIASNVIGVLPGNGPLAEETIIIGAHYDHVGRGGKGSLAPGSSDIHNGADDNASGTTLILELARRLGKQKGKLKRRVVIMAFAAEELGLLGSKAYVRRPVFPLEKTIAMINFDMVGRAADNVVTVFGTKTSSVWEPMLDRIEASSQLSFNRKAPGFGPSDHSSFYEKKIPVLHVFTGLHGDYHRPSDDWHKVNVQGIRRVTDFVESIVIELAQKETRLNYISVTGRSNPFNAAGSVPNFGSIPNLDFQGQGYQMKAVVAGSPADKAGVKAGDILVQFRNAKITSVNDFTKQLRSSDVNEIIKLKVIRGKKDIDLEVTVGRPR